MGVRKLPGHGKMPDYSRARLKIDGQRPDGCLRNAGANVSNHMPTDHDDDDDAAADDADGQW